MSIKSFVSDYAIATFGAVVFLVLASICLLLNCVIKSNRMKYARMINEIPAVEAEAITKKGGKGEPPLINTDEKDKKDDQPLIVDIVETSDDLAIQPSLGVALNPISTPSGDIKTDFVGNKFKSSDTKKLYSDKALNGELDSDQKNLVVNKFKAQPPKV